MNFPRAPRSTVTYEPHLTTAPDATPLDSDVFQRRFFIEDVFPSIDAGRFAVKRIVSEPVDVWADIFRDGHEVTSAALRWRREGERGWHTAPLVPVENDRWHGTFVPIELGRHVFVVEAWTAGFATWRRDTLAKQKAGVDITLDLKEGRELVAAVLPRAGDAAGRLQAAVNMFDTAGDARPLLAEDLAVAMATVEPRPDLTWSHAFPLMIERARARAGAWYEVFPRSQSDSPERHGTFDDVIARLPDVSAMGFDVLYFPPIHPIGVKNRKGKNNSLKSQPGEPGSPYAIGAAEGGHDAVHPQLGTIADFRRLVAAARSHGLEIALDFATQCSPDHPWIKEHADWFRWRPDGSMKYAENPPKKYEDITNPDFYCADRVALWQALRDVVLFWAEQGVRIFRVDNPHTKPFPFWEWMIREVQTRFPDSIFLSEAFTRPKVMKALAKLGFSQSYTYFTWRTGKDELSSYMAELTRHPEREYFRPNFFVNTPDILPVHLQGGEPWMFKSRVALAAILSGSYGVYNGFELLEHAPVPGKEEYLDSEKYEIKPRDWNAPGNIKDYIARLNAIRRANPALQQTANFAFAQVDDPAVMGVVKESVAHDNVVAAAIAVAPGQHDVWFHFGDLRIGPDGARRPVRAVENLVTGEWRLVEWGGVRLAIDTDKDPIVMLRCVA